MQDFELANISIRELQPRVLTVDSDFNLTLAPGQSRPRNLRVRVFAGTRDDQISYGTFSDDDCPKYDSLVIALNAVGDSLRFGWGIPREWADIGGSGTREYLLVFEKPERNSRAAGANWRAEPFRLAKECIRDYFDKAYRVQVRMAVAKPAAATSPATPSPFAKPEYVQLIKTGQCFRIRGGCSNQNVLMVVPCELDLTPRLVSGE